MKLLIKNNWRYKMKNVLLISSRDEKYYFAPFAKLCLEKSISVYVLDQTEITESKLYINLSQAGDFSGMMEVYKYQPTNFVRSQIDLEQIDIAWYLRPGKPSLRSCKNDVENRFVLNESMSALHSLLTCLDCKWVNKKRDIDLLRNNKLLQQKIAVECNLDIPETTISNVPDRVLSFSKDRGGLLLKSMGYIRLDDEGLYALYSEKFSHRELEENSIAIASCPIFAQEYIKKKYEYRVMVIGEHVLSCRIDSQASEKTEIDWRHYDFENVAHENIQLPQEIQDRLLAFMQKIGLRYGAIDMIETPEGDFVFLEINPSGQWGWIADLANLPIPQAVVRMLEEV